MSELLYKLAANSMVCWALLYGVYRGWLWSHVPIATKRVFILSSLWVGGVLAFIPRFEVAANTWVLPPLVHTASTTLGYAPELPWLGWEWLVVGYWVGVAVACVRLLGGIVGIVRMLQVGTHEYSDVYCVVRMPNTVHPFSIGRYIFLGSAAGHSATDEQCIITHERAHIYHGHTADLFFVALLSVFFWFNPFLYLFRRELQRVHEYQADRLVLRHYPVKYYCNLLLQQTFDTRVSFVNSFSNVSQLKNRIDMMYSSSARHQSWRYLVAFAVLVGVGVLGISLKAQQVATVQNEPKPCLKSCVNHDDPTTCTIQEIMGHLGSHLKYPDEARKNGIAGTVYVQFLVDKKGNATRTILKPEQTDKLLADETLRVTADLKWSPAMVDDKPVKATIVLPVKFKLDDSEATPTK